MDDDEDFEKLFFSEARELLDALQEHLNLLAEDSGDEETVHAAFRAVHSVKGGAAAFGFDQLIAFAHVFETVMDHIRDGRLTLDPGITRVLQRSGDMMQVLVENAESGGATDEKTIARLSDELEALTGAPQTKPAQKTEAETESAPAERADTDEQREIRIRVVPDDDFFASGHDMLKLLRSAKALGLVSVDVDGQVEPLENFRPEVCTLGWTLTFQTPMQIAEVLGFFDVYDHLAQIDILDEDAVEETAATEPDGTPDTPPATSVTQETTVDQIQTAVPESPGTKTEQRSDRSTSLRVDISRIDRLVNLVGEMLITQAAVSQQLIDFGAASETGSDLAQAVDAMSRQLRELQDSVMSIRAQPVRSVFRRMPRVVRDLADKLGKEVKIDLFGENTEVDTTVIEELAEPLTHMIRNAMDHGLEPTEQREDVGKPRCGLIRLSAEHRGERVIITIEDDGRGINRDRVLAKARERGLVGPDEHLAPEDIDLLIFHPGFSTAQEVSAVSGRGVGMDVVKRKIQALGGRCSVQSVPGKGSRFDITLPLTLAIMDGMTIGVGGQKYILPLSSVVEALRVPRGDGRLLPDGTRVVERRGEFLKLMSLRTALQMPEVMPDEEMAVIVDTETNGLVAVVVDELIGQRQIVLKSLETNFRHVDGVSGATILGDGQVALILDIPVLMGSGIRVPRSEELMH